MKTHLIGDFIEFGIMDDNYDKFISERAEVVSKELKKRIIEQEIDKTMGGFLLDIDMSDFE